MLSAAELLKRRFASPARFSTTSSDDRRSPYAAPKAPAVNSKRCTVSGLNALVRPDSRYGLWISTPSMMVRFWSGDPPRTDRRLPKSSVAATPGKVCRTWKMLSPVPAAARTAFGSTAIVAGRSGTDRGAVTSTRSSYAFFGTRRISRLRTSSAPTVTFSSESR